jgi:N-acyl-L-homoserine lactone synthetase
MRKDNSFANAIASAQQELVVEIARTPEQVLEAKKLRYRVYCEERGFEPGEGGIEQDEFDDNARHVLVRSRTTGEVFGTVRLVFGTEDADSKGLPMQRVCEDYVLAPLPKIATAEISRFALTRDRSGISPNAAALMRLFLIQGVVQVSGELGLTHWAAIMEKTLLRLLRSTSIYFLPVGPAVEYHGIRQPAIFPVTDGLERMRREQRQVWSFLTLNGTLCSTEMVEGGAQAEEALAA